MMVPILNEVSQVLKDRVRVVSPSQDFLWLQFFLSQCWHCGISFRQILSVHRPDGQVKIDTEKYPELASRFGVQALPTLVLFKNGQVADKVVYFHLLQLRVNCWV